jgi:cytochrome c-type biogenesis protein CcmH/NrfF
MAGSIGLSLKESNQDVINGVISQIQQGHLNCAVNGTLTVSAGSTVFAAPTCTAASAILACPLTADAAAALATMVFTPADGQFTVTHANNAQNDRTFIFIILG